MEIDEVQNMSQLDEATNCFTVNDIDCLNGQIENMSFQDSIEPATEWEIIVPEHSNYDYFTSEEMAQRRTLKGYKSFMSNSERTPIPVTDYINGPTVSYAEQVAALSKFVSEKGAQNWANRDPNAQPKSRHVEYSDDDDRWLEDVWDEERRLEENSEEMCIEETGEETEKEDMKQPNEAVMSTRPKLVWDRNCTKTNTSFKHKKDEEYFLSCSNGIEYSDYNEIYPDVYQ